MANLKDHKTVAAPFSTEEETIRVTYDFDDDGGATGDLNVITADGKVALLGVMAVVETAVTSEGSATLDLGPTGAKTQFANGVGKASLTQDDTVNADAVGDLPHVLTDGQSLIMGLQDAAWTAGKIHYRVRIGKPYQ